MPRNTLKHTPLPTKQQILDFIQNTPQRVGKHELSRAFHLTSEHRPFLRALMKELEEDGAIVRRHKRHVQRTGSLPEVTVIQIIAADSNGDLIARPATWDESTPPPRIYLLSTRKEMAAVGIGDKVLARLSPARGGLYNAHAIKRLASKPTRFISVLHRGDNGLTLRSCNRRDKQIYSVSRQDTADADLNDLVEAEVLPGRHLGLRQARVIRRLGSLGDAKAVSLIVIHENDIPTGFSAEALRQAEDAGPAPLGKRIDLRQIPLVTIDGEDARDFDDAVWAEPTKDGGWHALVAIADVAFYVTPDSPLDRAAYDRGNSVYFPDQVVPMLPEALSNGWCSLRPHEERPCLAVDMWFDAQGNKTRHTFLRGLMRSAARLTYTQVQAALEGAGDEATLPLLDPVLRPLHGCFQALRIARKHRGTLEIDLPERKVELDDHGNVLTITPRPRWDSHMLIEELMIAANVCAAETLEEKKQPCMYRVHEEPPLDRQETLRQFLRSLKLTLAHGALKAINFNKIMSDIKGKSEETIVNTLILRAQAQAVYSPDNRGHFGLGLRRYAHFTSPIRRYADLLVHRALLTGMGEALEGEALSQEESGRFETIGDHISQTERRAAAAERDATERYIAKYLSSRIGAAFTGRLTGVNRFGLFIELDETGASGLIPISTLSNDYYVFEEERHRLTGRKTGDTYCLGDAVVVRLCEADPITGGTLFEMLENYGAMPTGNSPEISETHLKGTFSDTRHSKKRSSLSKKKGRGAHFADLSRPHTTRKKHKQSN